MRSLFHFPFPCTQPPSQQPSPTARNMPSPASCTHAPLPSAAFRHPPAPRSCAYLDPAHGPLSPVPRAPAMPRPHPRLAPPPVPIAPHHLSTTPLLPAPIGLASSASCPPCAAARIACTPLRAAIRIPLCRHRADSALIAPPSRPSCAAIRIAPPIAPTARRRPRPPLALRRPQGPGWQESHCMHPLLAECAKKAPFLATSARNACSSRSEWQHPRPMHPFPGAIGRFGMHGARILPPRALFRVEEPEITHGAKMLPAPRGPSAAAACGPAERALRHAAAAWPNGLCALRRGPGLLAACAPPAISLVPAAACAPCHLARVHRRRLARVTLRRPHRAHHAVPVPMHLATCAPHPSRQPRGPTASRKQAEQHKQLNASIKIGSPNGDPIEELFGFARRLPNAPLPLHQANELALSYLDHSTRQRLGGYVIGLSGNSFTVDLYAALVDHATSIAR